MIVTRGVGDISYHFERVQGPTVVMVVKPYEPFPGADYTEGVAVGPGLGAAQPPQGPRPRHQVLQPARTTSWPSARPRPRAPSRP